jgi:transposase
MGVPRKQYSCEFKAEAVRLVTEQGLSISQVSRDLGINDNLLGRWKKELENHGSQAFPGPGQPHDEELAHLRRENEVLRREREI